jgi:phage-related protein
MAALMTVFARFRPDTTGFKQEAEAKLRALNLDAVSGSLGKRAGQAAAKAFGDSMSSGLGREIDAGFQKTEGKTDTAARKSGKKAGDGFGKGFSERGGTFAKVAATAAARATLFGSAAGAAAPGVLHLTAAVLPAAGALVQLPAAMLAVKAATATVKIAVAGVGDAITAGLTGTSKEAKKALEQVPPAARGFAKEVIALKTPIDTLRNAVAGQFFKPLTDDVRPLAQMYFPLLTRQMSNLAGPLGGLGEQFAETARKTVVFKAVGTLFDSTRAAVVNVRGAIDPLVQSFAGLIAVTAPNLPKLALSLANAATGASRFVTEAVKSGKVNAVYQAGVATLKDLGGILVNIGSIVGSVFKASAQGAGSLLGNFRDLTGQAAAFFRSADGAGALTSIFATLGTLGAAVRTSLGAVLPAVAQSIATIGPVLSQLAPVAAQLVVALAPLLPFFTQISATLISALIPALAGAAGWLVQHQTTAKVLASVLGGVLVATRLYAVGVAVAGAATSGWTIATKAAAIASKVWAGTQAFLNAVLIANPIGIVVVAIAALVAGIIIAYKHSETFRNIVDGAWKGIKIAISATVGWITGTVWPALKTAWDAIAAAAMWLWHNVFEPVWMGILAAVRFAIAFITAEINIGKAIFNGIATVVSWLYNNIFKPVWNAIATAVHNAWTIIQVVFALMKIGIGVLVAGFKAAWDNILHPVFNAIVSVVKWVWNNGIKPQFELIKAAWTAVAGWFTGIYNSKVKPLFNTLSLYVAAIIIVLKAKFELVKAAWTTVWSAISTFYTTNIKPIFTKLIGFLQDYVVKGFTNTVNNIKSAWAKVQDAAKKPVTFVVNSVINPLIRGFNKIAGAVGVKDRIAEIGGFAAGGRIPGAPSAVDNRLAQGPGGLLKVATGEYIVNARDTAKALPLLKWVNAGMKGGPGKAAEYLGRKVTDYPGDGSEGWAFSGGGRIPGYADGGLVGWVKNLGKDVWGALSNPTDLIKAPLEAALSKIPGSGMIRNFLVGTGKKLINGLTGFASKIVGGGGSTPVGGRVGAAASFIKAQDGKPYVWASAGPGGYDCSGIVSAAYNILKGRNPYGHTFSTSNAESYFNQHSLSGPLIAGWSHPGQSPASASVGHMAGQIAGMPFESRGSRGVIVGSAARRVGQFAQRGAAGLAHGGLVNNRQVQLMDQGGAWPTGTVRANMSGHTEQVLTGGPGGDINTLADILTAILDSIRALGPEVAAALERPTRRAVQLGRSRGAAT